MNVRACLWLLFLASVLGAATTAVADDNLIAASNAAEHWLALMDSGQYDESWNQAASFFKEKVTKEEWVSVSKRVRPPMGKVEVRRFKSAQYETKPPAAPEGKYIVFQYQTKLAGGGTILETVTPMLDKDGTWRVSGYFIHRD